MLLLLYKIGVILAERQIWCFSPNLALVETGQRRVNKEKIMIKKLSKYGNSLAIIIDKPILELLNITHDTSLKIRTDGERIIIEPVKGAPLEKLYRKNARKYAGDLKKLAKS